MTSRIGNWYDTCVLCDRFIGVKDVVRVDGPVGPNVRQPRRRGRVQLAGGAAADIRKVPRAAHGARGDVHPRIPASGDCEKRVSLFLLSFYLFFPYGQLH